MNEFTLVSKYFWIVFIAISFLNFLLMKRKVRPLIEKDTSLEDGYNKILKTMLIWGNLPWVVMGYGILTNQVESMFHYFRPQDMNPYVLVFFGSIFLIYALLIHWIFFKDGAEILLKHKGIFNRDFKSVGIIKMFSLLVMFIGMIGVVTMYYMDAPINKINYNDSTKKDFYIMQDNEIFVGDNITLKKRPFVIVSDEETYFVLFSKEPILVLKDKKKIVKLLGTSAAWDVKALDAALYKSSDILSDDDICELYNQVKCQKYSLQKKVLGFEDEMTYTFGSYPVVEKHKKFYTIDNKLMKNILGNYYIYLFTNIDKIDDISDIQEVKRLKINFKKE